MGKKNCLCLFFPPFLKSLLANWDMIHEDISVLLAISYLQNNPVCVYLAASLDNYNEIYSQVSVLAIIGLGMKLIWWKLFS